ncbi:hypothetical protein MKX01_041375 [Papaver californicum]|nr:hypothetical protein MKX01_041375 [Papaver californicum]
MASFSTTLSTNSRWIVDKKWTESKVSNDMMVILDNCIIISKTSWCSSNFIDNGFFKDKYFDPQIWIKVLTKMASIFNGSTSVVGMSLRNDLIGRKQSVKDRTSMYMQQGAEAVHAANPNFLVLLSRLNFDVDLSFLAKQPINLKFTGKLVYEENGNPNQVSGNIVNNCMRRARFLLEQGVALLGINVNGNRYFNCMMGVAAKLDLDWALWTLLQASKKTSKIEEVASIVKCDIILRPSLLLCIFFIFE